MFVITLKDNHFLFKNKFDARVIFPFIFIKKSKKDNKALLVHEKTHIKQVLQFRGFLYFFSKESRYKLEFEAYQNQLNYEIKEYIENHDISNKFAYRNEYTRLAGIYSEYMAKNYNLAPGTYNRAFSDFLANIDKI